MKTFALCLTALALSIPTTFGQSEAIAKQRAKGLADQNNARQAEPTAPGTAAPKSTAPPTPMVAPPVASKPNTHQQHIAKLKATLAAVRHDGKVTDKTKQEFAGELLAVAQGAGKPSATALSRLADDLLTALTAKNVSPAADEKLVLRMVVLANSAGLTPARTQEVAGEAQAALKSAGVSAADAAKISGDLEAIAADVRRPKS